MLIKKVQLALYSEQTYIKLKQPYQVFPSASYSGVLSLAAFVLFHNPKLPPPYYKGQLSQETPFDQKLADKHLSYNHYFQSWCDYFASCLEKGSAYIDNNQILYMLDKVNQDYLESFNMQPLQVKKWDQYEQNCRVQKCLNTIFGVKMQQKHKKLNIGIANFGSGQLRTDPFRPKVNLPGIIQGIWFGNNNWTHYQILKSNFPSESQFQDMDILFLSGSSLSVNDEDPQVEKFMKLFKQAVDKNQKLRIVGFCFGHQFLAKAFGGKVIKKVKIAGIENIKFNSEVGKSFGLLNNFEDQGIMLALSQYHSDYVDVLPENFINIATSKSAVNQAMISSDYRMMSFQYHPEYTTQFTKGYEYRAEGYKVADILQDFCGTGSSSKQHSESVWSMRRAISKFIQRQNE